MVVQMLLTRLPDTCDLNRIRNVVESKSYYGSDCFSEDRVTVVKDFLREINASTSDKLHNFWVSLKFSLRDSVINRSKANLAPSRYGVGLVIQFAPSITPISALQFALFSVLYGNQIITKISERSEEFIRSIENFNDANKELSNRLAKYCQFITYDAKRLEITNLLQSRAGLRVIWGSNDSIQEIRKSSLNPGSSEITFPDRLSILAVRGAFIDNLEDKDFEKAITNAARDIYEYDHGACSSPFRIFWLGSNVSDHSFQRFLNKLLMEINTRFEGSWAFSTERQLNHIRAQIRSSRDTSFIPGMVNFHVVRDPNNLGNPVGRGNIEVIDIDNASQLTKYVPENLQTCTYLGFTAEFLRGLFMSSNGPKPTRIVPSGSAMVMTSVWDRYKFADILSNTYEDY